MGGVGRVACQGFLVREAYVSFWWVELDLFSLEFSEVSSYEFRGVYGFDVTFWLPAFLCSGLCYFVVEGLAWYVLLCNLLALGWNLVSV